jgi:protein-S-isoprenylcysteine O-methyltransferase Ste14
MSGWRIEHLRVPWVLGGAASLLVGHLVLSRADPALSLAYFVATAAFYYGGNTAILGSRIARTWVARLGEQEAFRRYEALLALMFVNQGLGLGAMASIGPSLPIAREAALALGLSLAAVGLVIKVWATMLLGVDVYYYKDLFLRRPLSGFVVRGPYRVFANPMYGVGQLHAYGYAIVHRSWSGFVAAALCQALTYLFYFAVERPFVRAQLPGSSVLASAR